MNAIRNTIKNLTARSIRGGPFQGMRYVPEAQESALFPKLVGTYECEVASHFESLIRSSRNTIVDIGCAEGYYANGALFLNSHVNVVAFDLNPRAQALCAKVASLNGHGDRLRVAGFCGMSELLEVLENRRVDLIVMDIEGGELDLITADTLPRVAQIPLLIETHDFIRPGATEQLESLLRATHRVDRIDSRTKTWRDIGPLPFRIAVRALRRDRLLWERPCPMHWLVALPRGESSLSTEDSQAALDTEPANA